jgi:hypothetical protein
VGRSTCPDCSTLIFEWLLIFLLAGPMLAFALVVGDAAGG